MATYGNLNAIHGRSFRAEGASGRSSHASVVGHPSRAMRESSRSLTAANAPRAKHIASSFLLPIYYQWRAHCSPACAAQCRGTQKCAVLQQRLPILALLGGRYEALAQSMRPYLWWGPRTMVQITTTSLHRRSTSVHRLLSWSFQLMIAPVELA